MRNHEAQCHEPHHGQATFRPRHAKAGIESKFTQASVESEGHAAKAFVDPQIVWPVGIEWSGFDDDAIVITSALLGTFDINTCAQQAIAGGKQASNSQRYICWEWEFSGIADGSCQCKLVVE